MQEVDLEAVPITAPALGRDVFFSIVYGFKRQVLERAGKSDAETDAFFRTLEETVRTPSTFAMTTVFLAHGLVP